jgi:hypothetical protein
VFSVLPGYLPIQTKYKWRLSQNLQQLSERMPEAPKGEKMTEITFELEDKQHVNILMDGKKVGHIFSPSGSSENIKNAIQVCGFSEAFDLWGCGIFQGFKDIQLLFDDTKMGGRDSFSSDNCCRCYREPCQCEVSPSIQMPTIPFLVKHGRFLEKRLEKTKPFSETEYEGNL